MRKVIDIFFVSFVYTLVFFLSYKILVILEMVSEISWYFYFLIGFLNSIFFRLFGFIIGIRNVR